MSSIIFPLILIIIGLIIIFKSSSFKKDLNKIEKKENSDSKKQRVSSENVSIYFEVDYEEILSFEKELESLTKPNDELYDYTYWYSFVSGRASNIRNSEKDKSDTQLLQDLIFGHSDEYSKRFIEASSKEKSDFVKPRIICYGKIHDLIVELTENIQNKYPDDLKLIKRLRNESLHSEASLYGAIKFATINGIKKEQILKWYKNFDNKSNLIEGKDPIQNILEKHSIGDKEDRTARRYEFYELSEKERKEMPFWFKNKTFLYGYFKKGRQVTIAKNNKSIKLNRLERSLYWNYKCLSKFLENMSDEMSNYEIFIDMYETNELIKSYFKEENTEAYSNLIETQDSSNDKEVEKEDIGDLDSNSEPNEWTNEELAVLFAIFLETDLADGETNQGSDSKTIIADSLKGASKQSYLDKSAYEGEDVIEDLKIHAEKFMEVQSLAGDLYSLNNAEGGNLKKIKNDFSDLSISKTEYVSQCISNLIQADKEINPKKVEMAEFFSVPVKFKDK